MVYLKKIIKRIKYNIFPKKTIEYIGCMAVNLGDQVVLDAIEQTFPEINIVPPKGGNSFISRIIAESEKRQKRLASMLGGGTLIGPGDWSDKLRIEFESSLKRLGSGIVFGTGVSDLSFPSYQKEYEKDPELYRKWGTLLNQCQYVGVRGPQSKSTLAALGVEAEVIGDPVCFLVQEKGFWRPVSGLLGVNIGHGGGSIWGDRSTFYAAMTQFVSQAKDRGWNMEFFVLMAEDLEMTKKLALEAGINNPIIHCEYMDAKNYLEQARRMEAFVGMKLHSVILAMCALVPSIMMEYRPKGLDFMKSIGMESFNIRTSEVNSDSLFALLDELLKQKETISENIRERMFIFKELQKTRACEFLATHQN